jgi:hypothetical protein
MSAAMSRTEVVGLTVTTFVDMMSLAFTVDFSSIGKFFFSDQAFEIEKSFAPARHAHTFEQPCFAERIVCDEVFCFIPIVGIEDDDAALAASPIVVYQPTGGK